MPFLPSPADRTSVVPAAGLHESGWPFMATALGGTLADASAAVAAAMAAGSGLLLAARRLAGALAPPPVPEAAAAVACVGLLLVAIADLRRQGGRAGLIAPLAARGGLLLAMLAVTIPAVENGRWHVGHDSVGNWMVTALAVVVAVGTVLRLPLRLPGGRPTADGRRPHRNRRVDRGDRPATGAPHAIDAMAAGRLDTRSPEPRTCPGRLRQEQQRFEPAPDTDCLRGRLMLTLPAGAKTAHGHVGFCPAFVETPRMRVTTDYDGVEAVVAAAEVLPWGVRLECRLAEPAEEPLEIPIDFLAETRV